MGIEVRELGQQNVSYLANVLPGVFDNPVDNRLSAEFLADPRHHLVVAIDDGAIIGFASAVHYVHRDKPAELWINEVGVASAIAIAVWQNEFLMSCLSWVGGLDAATLRFSLTGQIPRPCNCTSRLEARGRIMLCSRSG